MDIKSNSLKVSIEPHRSLRNAMTYIDKNMKGIVVVVDEKQKLLYTITDGDLRRAVLDGLNLDLSIEQWAQLRSEHGNRKPRTAPVNTPKKELLSIMQQESLHHIPLIDKNGCFSELVTLDELLEDKNIPVNAVVMAGGKGERLQPLTDKLPKPMLPVGDQSILERIIGQLKKSGINRVHLTTHYKADLISNHFGNGKDFGVEIEYIQEQHPLGTAGSLCLLKKPNEPLLVINGDVLTQLDFRDMLNFHLENDADMTVAVKEHEIIVPYGVVETDGVMVRGLSEKPVVRNFINAGIYLLDPDIFYFIPDSQYFNMTDLISMLANNHKRVICFPIREYWRDIGELDEYNRAIADAQKGVV